MPGLGRRTFAAGEVLTATNVMNYLQDQAVMTFAGTAARGSAIGSAVSEGMVSYLADSNQIEVYDGSVWKPTLGLAQVAPTSVTPVGAGSASYTAAGEITYTGVNSLRVNGVFSARFKNYLIIWNNLFSSGNPDFTIQWSTSGTASNTGYWRAGMQVNQSGTISSFYSGANQDGHVIGSAENGFNSGVTQGTMTVLSPFTTDATFAISDAHGVLSPTGFRRWACGSAHGNVSRDGFYFLPSTGTVTGRFQVYGYN